MLPDELSSVFRDIEVLEKPNLVGDIALFLVTTKCETEILHEIMGIGWTVMATWIENDDESEIMVMALTIVSFRLGKGDVRLVLTADVRLATADGVIPNIDADEPGDNPEIISGLKTSLGKLRAAAISGYGPYASLDLGLKDVTAMPKLSIIGLDVEVTTFGRDGGMPLPYDELVSIAISNGGWYDKQFPDRCYYIYTFGVYDSTEWESGSLGTCVRASGSRNAVAIAYKILNEYSADYINIHNGFNFDLRDLSCWAVGDPEIEDSFEERRLGNVGVGIFWKLKNGSMAGQEQYPETSCR